MDHAEVAEVCRRPVGLHDVTHDLGHASTDFDRIEALDAAPDRLPVHGGSRKRHPPTFLPIASWSTARSRSRPPEIVASTSPCSLSIRQPPGSMEGSARREGCGTIPPATPA